MAWHLRLWPVDDCTPLTTHILSEVSSIGKILLGIDSKLMPLSQTRQGIWDLLMHGMMQIDIDINTYWPIQHMRQTYWHISGACASGCGAYVRFLVYGQWLWCLCVLFSAWPPVVVAPPLCCNFFYLKYG